MSFHDETKLALRVAEFMNALHHTKMRHEDIASRGFDFALTVLRGDEQQRLGRDQVIDPARDAELMAAAARIVEYVGSVGVQIGKEDNANDAMLYTLSIDELTHLWRKRHDRADMALGAIMMKTMLLQRAEQENSVMISLLKECLEFLGSFDTLPTNKDATLFARLAEYVEAYDAEH